MDPDEPANVTIELSLHKKINRIHMEKEKEKYRAMSQEFEEDKEIL